MVAQCNQGVGNVFALCEATELEYRNQGPEFSDVPLGHALCYVFLEAPPSDIPAETYRGAGVASTFQIYMSLGRIDVCQVQSVSLGPICILDKSPVGISIVWTHPRQGSTLS